MGVSPLSVKKAVLTGATGFIGKAVANALSEMGCEVTLLVRPDSLSKLNDVKYTGISAVDLDFPADMAHVIGPCDVVIHAASIRNRWGTSPDEYRRVNVEATRALLAASAGQARRFVYISSVGVFGFPGKSGLDEESPVLTPGPDLDYHTSKVMAEEVVRSYGKEIETVIIRPTITYGVGDRDGMVTRLVGMLAGGKYVQVGSGRNHLHLTYIDDLVDGIIRASALPAAAGRTFILAGPEPIEMRELAAQIAHNLHLPKRHLYLPEPLARLAGGMVEALYRAAGTFGRHLSSPPITREKVDIVCAHRSFSFARAASLLGYVPRTGYAEGLARTIDWMVATHQLRLNTIDKGETT